METSKRVKVWSDGSTLGGNPSHRGGWGVVLKFENSPFYWRLNGLIDEETTNNRAETIAIIEFLQLLKEPHSILIITDSQYVVYGLRRILNNSLLKTNQDLWKHVRSLVEKGEHHITYQHVRGHKGVTLNEVADELADKGAKENFIDDRFYLGG